MNSFLESNIYENVLNPFFSSSVFFQDKIMYFILKGTLSIVASIPPQHCNEASSQASMAPNCQTGKGAIHFGT
jgi:hypothetical protein